MLDKAAALNYFVNIFKNRMSNFVQISVLFGNLLESSVFTPPMITAEEFILSGTGLIAAGACPPLEAAWILRFVACTVWLCWRKVVATLQPRLQASKWDFKLSGVL
jgi:hypothetical protein